MGSVNIFLGGTGKHIAEDIQDSRDFYDLKISEPVAFDLDSERRPGVDLRRFVHPGDDSRSSVEEIARTWASHQLGSQVAPAESSREPGPQLDPAHSVLVAIGQGIAANPSPTAGLYALRGHGLTVFSALFDDARAIAGAGAGLEFRRHIADAVSDARAGDGSLRFNLITSTAGGTGAGTVIPLALWLREQYQDAPLTLIAVTPEAFSSVLHGSPNMDDLAAKGRSGTYAMLRELSFFRKVDPQAAFSPRTLPVTSKGLAYAPGQDLFERVYWFGGREANRPRDAFEEAGALLRILNTDNTAEELRGKTGAFPLQAVGALTAVEYPRLRLQRKLVSRVLEHAYRGLRGARQTFSGGEGAASAVALLDYVDNETPRERLGSWFNAQRTATLAGRALTRSAAQDLVDLIHAEADIGDYAGVSHGARVRGANYDSSDLDWGAYVGTVTEQLRREALAKQQKLERAIPAMRAAEEEAFAGWIGGAVFGEDGWLSGEPGDNDRPLGIADVRSRLERLEQDARGLEERIDDDNFLPGETVADCDKEIQTLTDRFQKPEEVPIGPNLAHRFGAIVAAIAVGLIGGLALQPVWEGISRFGEFGPTALSEVLVWLGVALVAVLAYRLVIWLPLRSKQQEATVQGRRQGAEERLFAAFGERDRVRALHWMHEHLRRPHGKEPFFRELRHQIESVQARVEDLDKLYKELGDQAAAEVASSAADPAHVKATIGDCLAQGDNVAVVPEISRRLRIEATIDPSTHRVRSLNVRLERLQTDEDAVVPVSVDVGAVLAAIAPDGGGGTVTEQDSANRWKNSLWGLVNWQLGQKLPDSFESALLHCAGDNPEAATHELVTKLNGLDLPRRSSVALQVPASDPVFRKVYVGSNGIQAHLSAAIEHPALDRQIASRLREYVNASIGLVPSLGEQMVFLDLWADDRGRFWAPNVISNAVEADAAMNTYYGTDPNNPADATALETCFTVIPELLAATRLEIGPRVAPLHPAVTARLLGSDPETQGPTYAELFYLLRTRHQLGPDNRGEGPDRKVVVILNLDDRPLDLVSYSPGEMGDPLFGRGRETVVAFDAFCEFMRHRNVPSIAGAAAIEPFRTATLEDAGWLINPQRLADLQREAARQWYTGDIDDDRAEMLRQLEEDLARMDGDREVRDSWGRAMSRLLGEERSRIRAGWLERPAR